MFVVCGIKGSSVSEMKILFVLAPKLDFFVLREVDPRYQAAVGPETVNLRRSVSVSIVLVEEGLLLEYFQAKQVCLKF